MIIAMTTGFASACFAEGDPPAECLSGCEPEEPVKGNNGWGNGPDTTNAGSSSGGTAVTKSVNGLGADKFDGKFVGR
jgi:hypothetical protein